MQQRRSMGPESTANVQRYSNIVLRTQSRKCMFHQKGRLQGFFTWSICKSHFFFRSVSPSSIPCVLPADPPNTVLSLPAPEQMPANRQFAVGEFVVYRCATGFTRTSGSGFLRCADGGVWVPVTVSLVCTGIFRTCTSVELSDIASAFICDQKNSLFA